MDLKWSYQTHALEDGREVPVLAAADAKGDVVIFGLVRQSDEDMILKQLSKFSLSDDDEKLALSLDWDVRNKGQLLVSDSKGQITVLVLNSSAVLEVVHSWKAHDFEAWTSAFDLWSSSLRVFSGGDDCKLKAFDVDRSSLAASPVFVIKEHSMGVTSLLSDARIEFRLYSGSYDENLNFWDTRLIFI